MALETGTYINSLTATNPTATDPKSEGDDHIRLLKSTIKATFPNVTGATTATHTEMNLLVGKASIAQIASPQFTGVVSVGPAPSYSFMSQGCILDQGAFDDEILSLRSSDIAHGITTLANTETFGTFKKYSATVGGVNFTGYSESTVGVGVRGVVTTEDSTRSTAAVAPVMIEGLKKSGTTSAAMSANVNVMVITDGTNARFIFDSDGDSHQDVGTAWTNYDHLDDVATLDALAYNVARKDDPIKRKFGEWMAERRDALTEQNLVKFSDDGHHFVNMSKLTMLHTGAIRQMGEKLDQAMQVIANLQLRLESK